VTYSVAPFVKINGITYNDKAIEGMRITLGRNNIDEQPRAGFCNVDLILFDNQNPTINIDDRIQLGIEDSTNTERVLYTGRISDLSRTLVSQGEKGLITNLRITGIGSLALLNRRTVGTYPIEQDGVRIEKILLDTVFETWQTVSSTLQWDDVDADLTWQTFDPFAGEIDAGDFDVIAQTQSNTNAFSLASQVAQSANGVLHERADGKIYYSDNSRRALDVGNNGYVEITPDAILVDGLSTIERLSDLANDITIQYGTGGAFQVNAFDQTSIDTYGEFKGKWTTLLNDELDAEAIRDLYLGIRSTPKRVLSQIAVPIHLDDIDDTLRDSLMGVYVGMPIRVTSLPDSIYDDIFTGFVEGYQWTINRNSAFLVLNVSEFSFSIIAQRWENVNPALEWQDVDAALNWNNALVVV
jgi:hypothetical protein